MEEIKHTQKIVERLLAERVRQINEKGWTTRHDDGHENGELSKAAACYALGSISVSAQHESLEFATTTEIIIDPFLKVHRQERGYSSVVSPIKETIEKKTRIRQLEIAGAFIIAEIERLERLEQK